MLRDVRFRFTSVMRHHSSAMSTRQHARKFSQQFPLLSFLPRRVTCFQCEGLGAKSICPNDPSRCAPLNQTQYDQRNVSLCHLVSSLKLLLRFCGGANQPCAHDSQCLPICWDDCFPCNSKVNARHRFHCCCVVVAHPCSMRLLFIHRRATATCSLTLVISTAFPF